MSEVIATIRGLDSSEWRVLKEIKLLGRIGHEVTGVMGTLLYTRPLTPEYKPKERPDVCRFQKCLYGLRQEDYPNDWFDEMILDAVKAQFPESMTRSELILFDVDFEKIERLKNQRIISAEISVTPDLQDVDPRANEGRRFEIRSLALNVYTMYPREEVLQNLLFFANYRVSDKDLADVLSSVKFE